MINQQFILATTETKPLIPKTIYFNNNKKIANNGVKPLSQSNLSQY
jgi:hypothetical protein